MFEATIIAIALLFSTVYMTGNPLKVKPQIPDALMVIMLLIYLIARFAYLLYAGA